MKLFTYKTETSCLCFCCTLVCSMGKLSDCAWCNEEDLEWRTIRKSSFSRSFVSKPWFRGGQCLVIPLRHISSIHELNPEEAADIMAELGRLGKSLDEGFGTGVMQKFAPLQGENGIKMSHLHFHVFPRQEVEEGLFPTPYPNDFSAFYQPTQAEVVELVEKLRK